MFAWRRNRTFFTRNYNNNNIIISFQTRNMARRLMFGNVETRKTRTFRHSQSHLLSFDDNELRARYRFGKQSITFITNLLRDDLVRDTNRNKALSAETQILITLRYFATGSFMQVVGDTFGVDKYTVSRIVHTVSKKLCSNISGYVKFPNDLQALKRGFLAMASFPNIIGCIDGTQIRILAPSQHENDFVNRKGYHSINVQAICDHESRLLNVVARWPGSTHDSRIFRESSIGTQFERTPGKGILLGDAGYPCKPYLMTPYPNPRTRQQERFNTAHVKTRSTIERTFGIWKRRFHILHSEIRLSPEKVCSVVGACAVLHNIAILMKEPVMEGADEVEDVVYQTPHDEDGKGIRDCIANTYFS